MHYRSARRIQQHNRTSRTHRAVSHGLVPALLPSLLLGLAQRAHAQAENAQPVTWSLATAPRGTSATASESGIVRLTARIRSGWHVYALTQQDGGPFPLQIRSGDSAVTVVSTGIIAPPAERQPTSPFGVPIEWYSGAVHFDVPVRRARAARGGRESIQILVRYQACSDTLCLPPKTVRLFANVVLAAPANTRGAL